MSDYAFWTKALEIGAGRRLSKDEARTLNITTEPQPGFYRKRNKESSDTPVAIWEADGAMVAVAGGRQTNAEDIWTWCCDWPISEQTYRDVAENGQPWSDEPPAATIGHNQPTDLLDALRVEFEGEKELAETFLSSPIDSQDKADQAAVWSKRLAAITKKATDLHKVEKQPHLDAGRAVDDKWRALKEEPDALSKRLKRHLDAWLLEQQRKERERQEAERRAAEELRRQAAESDQKSEEQRVALLRQAQEAEKAAEAKNMQAGRTGAKVALRTFVSARVTDYDAAAKALLDANHREFKETIDQLANRAVRAGVTLAGVERVEEQRAA